MTYETREELAALAHEQWTGWMQYLFSKCAFNSDGIATIPAWAVERWQRQAKTPYAELPELEKESDRAEADKVLNLMRRQEVTDAERIAGLEQQLAQVQAERDKLRELLSTVWYYMGNDAKGTLPAHIYDLAAEAAR